jgi:hypothetical protein
MEKRIFYIYFFYNAPFGRNRVGQKERWTDGQADRQTDRRTDVWLLCMWMKETQGLRATKDFRKTLGKTIETYKSRGFISS